MSVYSRYGPHIIMAALFLICPLPIIFPPQVLASSVMRMPTRIVSMSPGITSTLVALDLLDRVVGVTDWCDVPPGAGDIARIGGHIDPNYEAILGVDPDLVIVETANTEARGQLDKLGLDSLEIEHRHIAGILASITRIGEACGVQKRAAILLDDMRSRLQRLSAISATATGPRTLIIVGRDIATGHLQDIYAAGSTTFLGELLERAGGENIAPGKRIGYPILSREAVLRLDPEVVLELSPELGNDPRGRARLLAAWGELSGVAAVDNHRVHIICNDELLIPGPHFIETLEIFVEMLFPGS